ncbi:MAG: N4-gp56 family major capsid protein [Steroidobacteraceae bacterium]
MQTNVPVGSPLARKAYSVGLFSKVQSEPGFMNLLSGEMPQEGTFAAKAKGQTSPDYPVVKCGDLSKDAGDTVSVDLFNILKGKPTMGDRRIAGHMMALTYSSMDVKIDQFRAGADSGGRMTQKRTVHNLRKIAMASLQGYMARYEDQATLVHLAGARGSQNHVDWVVPLSTDPDFADIMVNAVKAPTKNRKFYAGAATSVATVATTDALTLQDIERIGTQVRESSVPMQSIKIKGDDRAWGSPLWTLFVTERQWLFLKARVSTAAFNTMAKDAFERKAPGVKHPLFDSYDTIMWSGILIKRMGRYATRFNAGDSVVVDSGGADGGTYTETSETVGAGITVDRAVLLGAQALAKVYGKSKSDYFYDWSEEEVDHGNAVETVGGSMGGSAKIRFNIDGVDTDFGVSVIDSYSPDPASAAGRTLLGS